MKEEDRNQSLTPFQKIDQQREEALSQLEAGEKEAFGKYLKDLTLELNSEMRLLTGPEGGGAESAWLFHYCTAILAAMWLVDTRTALECGVKPVWLDLGYAELMGKLGYRGFFEVSDEYKRLRMLAFMNHIRGFLAYRKNGRDCYEPE